MQYEIITKLSNASKIYFRLLARACTKISIKNKIKIMHLFVKNVLRVVLGARNQQPPKIYYIIRKNKKTGFQQNVRRPQVRDKKKEKRIK